MPVGDCGNIAVWRNEIPDAKARHGDLGETRDVERALGRKGLQRRRPVFDQGAEDIVLDDGNVMPGRNGRQRLAPLNAHQRRRRVDHRRLEENGADGAFPARLVQSFRDHAIVIDRQTFQVDAQIGGERHQRVVADCLGRNRRSRRCNAHQGDGHAGRGTIGQIDVERRKPPARIAPAIRPPPPDVVETPCSA